MSRRTMAALVAASVAVVGAALPATAEVGATSAPATTPPMAADDRTAVTPAQEQRLVQNRYVVLMKADPVVGYEGGVPGIAPTKPSGGEGVDTGSASVREYVQHLKEQRKESRKAAAVPEAAVEAEYSFAVNGFAAELTEEQAQRLAKQEGVLAVRADTLQQPQTDASGEFLGLTGPDDAWAEGYTGEGVVVGVIDTGIWPEHPSFADDGTYPDPVGVAEGIPCEFGTTPGNEDDAAFECNNKLLGARDMRAAYNSVVGPELYDSARDADGHGTHVASTAAGNAGVQAEVLGSQIGAVSGVAPRAQVLAYKVCGDLGCFTSDLAGGIDQAVADGVDVINYSIGGGAGPVGPDDLAFLFANAAGIFVATSAGNDGPAPGTVGSPAVFPWLTSVGASTHDRGFAGSVTLGDGRTFEGASITGGLEATRVVDAADYGNELCLLDTFEADLSGTVVLCKRGQIARVEKSQAVFEAGGAGMVLYDVSDDAALVTDNHWVPSVHVNLSAGQAVKAYVDAEGEAATAAITGGETVAAQGSVMADFSSRGPNAVTADVIVPDVTAPGVNILAGHTPTPTLGAPGQLFQSISGTSMSSPHVAGLFALLKQAHPDWSPAAAKSAIMTTARQDVVKEDGVTPADPFDMGAGHVEPSGTDKGSVFQPGLVYDAGFTEYLGFLCGIEADVFADPAATCGRLASNGVPTDPSGLNLASIAIGELAGSQTITRTITNVTEENAATTYRASVQAPEGFDVTVSPSQVTLRRGESATVEITVTTLEGAPEGEFSFGSLTWQSMRGSAKNAKAGPYEVRSPIAVRAVAIDTPPVVSGTGTDGSVTVPVVFGYEGAYAASAHGLVPATVTAGSVGQDPDQTPFTPDDGAGITAHTFEVTEAAVARWRLVEGTADTDLDVFVVGPDGEQVATSTNGGTNELVTLTTPASGTYTVYIHGWQTGGTSIAYDLESWFVPLATGGSLEITSAPTEATIAASADVVASWTGAAAGVDHLGAVAHSRGDELLGLTLVEVTG
ncbi:S8 family peptidase [Actinotalea sp. Marseille-Q4924]|uniref:S8 family peptidase n=1 Tax=Actinotalea sp. Marseille-Q4924 TaxID=2866571 RepID=UPI001CE3E978|nr:S8 family peptidase [Actinotalea sp. Marseille-Q4924]